ncbi:MAG TPA: DUF992 domain-containing protein [Pseudolabrys sp.]|jgi:hypothetical protein|nr:DUF992 domain-containing protein [Pseudolabrys sp.]
MSLKLCVRSALAAALFSLVLTATGPARAGEIGLLTCRSPQTTGYIFWSSTAYDCVFQSSVGGGTHYYRGVINRAGAEIGWSGNIGLAWLVIAASDKVGPGTLAGGYGGVSAGAAVGLGLRANALVGGLPNSITLQPVSVEGETGLNARATVTGLWLEPAGPGRRHHARRHRHM